MDTLKCVGLAVLVCAGAAVCFADEGTAQTGNQRIAFFIDKAKALGEKNHLTPDAYALTSVRLRYKPNLVLNAIRRKKNETDPFPYSDANTYVLRWHRAPDFYGKLLTHYSERDMFLAMFDRVVKDYFFVAVLFSSTDPGEKGVLFMLDTDTGNVREQHAVDSFLDKTKHADYLKVASADYYKKALAIAEEFLKEKARNARMDDAAAKDPVTSLGYLDGLFYVERSHIFNWNLIHSKSPIPWGGTTLVWIVPGQDKVAGDHCSH